MELAGVRAVLGVFDDAGMVTQTVDGANDIGKDLYVDLAENGVITGYLIAIQVKSGHSYRRANGYAIPCSEEDVSLWKATSVPIFGIVFDPDSNSLHWTNLTAWARGLNADRIPSSAPVESTWSLSKRTLSDFVGHAKDFIDAAGPPALIGLCDDDPNVQVNAVGDAFVLGRNDARSLLLLRASIRWLHPAALDFAIRVLALCEGHGDVVWTASNWLDQSIRNRVVSSFNWSYEEVCLLLTAVEEDEWCRGGRGQDVDALLRAGSRHHKVRATVEAIVRTAPKAAAWPALVHLVSSTDDARPIIRDLLPKSPALSSLPAAMELSEIVFEHGTASAW